MKWNLYAKAQQPEERAFSWEEGLSSLPGGEWVNSWVTKRDDAGTKEICMPRHKAMKNKHLLERKVRALYWRVSELMPSPKLVWLRIKWILYAKVLHPEKRASSWKEGLSSLPKGEWAVAESQRRMTKDKLKIVCQAATLWKAGILLGERVEPLTEGEWAVGEFQRGMAQDKVKIVCQVATPEKRTSYWQKGLSSLLEGEWAVADPQRGMTKDKVNFVCQRAIPLKVDIFLRDRVELFTGRWVS